MLTFHRDVAAGYWLPHARGALAPRQAWLRHCHGRPAPPALRSSRACQRLPALQLRSQYVPASQPAPQALTRRAPLAATDIVLPRSMLMGREVITRTSGKRLGYINQMYVDPGMLQVVSLYLRQDALLPFSSVGATTSDHFHVRNLLQIGDVVLVHDEQVLMEPPANESCGYFRLVGSTVKTEGGVTLGKVRDYLFNPDNGQISTIKYDTLGIPALPQLLLTTYCLSWVDVVAIGPAEIIVRSGSELRAIKENDGLLSENIILSMASTLANIPASLVSTGLGGSTAGEEEAVVRDDPEYVKWWIECGEAHEAYYGEKVARPSEAALQAARRKMQRPGQQAMQPAQQQPAQQRPARAAQRALPPPSSQSYDQALQPQQAGQGWQVAPARDAVPSAAGWGSASAAAPAQSRMQQLPPQQQQPPPAGWQAQGGLAEVQFQAQPAARQAPQQPPVQRQQQQLPPSRPAAGPPARPRNPPLPPYPQPTAPPQQWAQPPQPVAQQPWGPQQPAQAQPDAGRAPSQQGRQGQRAPLRGMQGPQQGLPLQQQQKYPLQPRAQQ